jgi:hypothetical protein
MVFDAPSRWVRVCAIQAVLIVAITAAAATTAMATPGNALSPRVRSSDAVIRSLITEAAGHSRTFRRLLETIENSDGIVYVESGNCGHGVRACLTMSVTPAGDYRILRILIDMRQKPRDLMASIGHELRHATEVLEDRALVDNARLYLFYAQRSGTKDHPFETSAAIQAGFAVRNEIESSVNAAR